MGLYNEEESIIVVFGEGDLITNGVKLVDEDVYAYMGINENLDGSIELNYEDDSLNTPCNKSEHGVFLVFQTEKDIDKMIKALQKLKS